ncbi:hypothetical protein SADUNF_Sadunf17G0077200 [Salix dunnii]|uniref:Uncharacterized protein n=1 Tax=Salix dunnii TaxID=1413687 RepID=A0A835MEY5_9ROSI|nr:hypothetical protein SADUNF_Sadunf17G0077200 [Salix dunnii]
MTRIEYCLSFNYEKTWLPSICRMIRTERESVEKKDDEKYQDVGSLYCDEICESIAKKEISSAALVLDESMDSFQSPEYFSFQQELPETESKGSSMIRESNVEFFSKGTPLSTARLEGQSASEMLGATENGSSVNQVQQYDEHNQSPEHFSFQQELPETDSKGSSMIRESNAEFFSTFSTARLEAHSASEMIGAT